MTTEKNESLLTFPCDFVIKVFGEANDGFEKIVLELIHKHVPNLSGDAIQTNISKNSKYKALSITLHVNNQAQLDQIYRDLSASSHVLMVL